MDGSPARTSVSVVGASASLAALCESLETVDELVLLRRQCRELADPCSDAVLLEVAGSDDPEHLLSAVRDLTAAPVVLLASSPSLVAWALDAGVADVLVHPYDAGGVLFALEKAVRAARNVSSASVARVVTVFSPKGGTGKSVLAANLATALARRGGRRTLLVDFDLQFGDAAIMLGLRPRQTLRELVASPVGLDAETLAVYTERHPSGLEVLAAPLRPEEAELVDDAVIRNVLGIARATHDAVIVDTSPFFHGSTLAALDVTDELLLLCSPDVPTVKNVRLALETLELLALPSARVRVVLNRYGEAAGLPAGDVSDALGRNVDFVLPFDPAVPLGVNRGTPAVLQASHGPFGEAVLDVARGLFPEGWPAPSARRGARRRLLAFAGG